jgi:light-regulated signal transduction histidine kinase (bacteriophytochrome)
VAKEHLTSLAPAIHRALRDAEQSRRWRRSEEKLRRLNRELEHSLARQKAELEAANREIEAFSFSVSHDLRAPLRHIEGFVEILASAKAESLDEEAKHFLHIIADSTRRMSRLIEDLLTFSRTARAELHKTNLSLEPLVAAISRELTANAPAAKVEWVVGKLPQVEADPALLRRVLLSLIGNALKFSGSRPAARIEIGASETDTEHIVFVRDNGVGFDPRYAHKLFGVFQRLHRPEEFEGSGMGLANVRRIIHRHGGRTWAEGQPDQGATFYFSLPKAESRAKPSD